MEIEVLYPIYDLDKNDVCRLHNSIQSIISNKDHNFVFCFSDLGKNKSLDLIKTIIKKFKYTYEKGEYPFNKSRCFNLGVKKLIKNEIFILSDIDIVIRENFINDLLEKLDQYSFVPSYSIPLCVDGEFCKNKSFEELRKYKLDSKWRRGRSGFTLLKRGVYFSVKGYDENFKGWGWEDVDFRVRYLLTLKKTIKTRDMYSDDIETLHQFHKRRDMAERDFEKANFKYYNNKIASKYMDEFFNIKEKLDINMEDLLPGKSCLYDDDK
jgi:hypothetical protein